MTQREMLRAASALAMPLVAAASVKAGAKLHDTGPYMGDPFLRDQDGKVPILWLREDGWVEPWALWMLFFLVMWRAPGGLEALWNRHKVFCSVFRSVACDA